MDPNAAVSSVDVDDALKLQPIDIPKMAAQERLSELDIMALTTNDSTYAKVGWRGGVGVALPWDCSAAFFLAVLAAGPAWGDHEPSALCCLFTLHHAGQAPPGVEYYRKPFEFLSLGIMAYVGNEKALVSAEVLDSTFNIAGSLAFLLWRSVYITKQVSFRNRVLILL